MFGTVIKSTLEDVIQGGNYYGSNSGLFTCSAPACSRIRDVMSDMLKTICESILIINDISIRCEGPWNPAYL